MYELKTSGNMRLSFSASLFFFSFFNLINPVCVNSASESKLLRKRNILSACPGGDLLNSLVFLFIAQQAYGVSVHRYGVTVTLNRTTVTSNRPREKHFLLC